MLYVDFLVFNEGRCVWAVRVYIKSGIEKTKPKFSACTVYSHVRIVWAVTRHFIYSCKIEATAQNKRNQKVLRRFYG